MKNIDNYNEENINYIRETIKNKDIPDKAFGLVEKNDGPTKILINKKSRKIIAQDLING